MYKDQKAQAENNRKNLKNKTYHYITPLIIFKIKKTITQDLC